MTVEAIKIAIAELSETERSSLAAWIIQRDYDEWDRQMVKDFAPGGQGMEFLNEVKREIAEGKARPMAEGLAEQRKPRS